MRVDEWKAKKDMRRMVLVVSMWILLFECGCELRKRLEYGCCSVACQCCVILLYRRGIDFPQWIWDGSDVEFAWIVSVVPVVAVDKK